MSLINMNDNEMRIVNFQKICRLCLNERKILMEIFESTNDKNNFTIDQKIMACATIELTRDDGLPARICFKCLSSVNSAFDFRVQCENADKILHNLHDLLLANESNIDQKEELQMIESVEDNENTIEVDTEKVIEDPSHIIVIKKQDKEVSKEPKVGDLFYMIDKKDSGEEILEDEIMFCNEGDLVSGDSSNAFSCQAEEEKNVDPSNSVAFTIQNNVPETYKVVIKTPIEREGIGVTEIKMNDKKKIVGDSGKSPCPFCNKMLTRVEEHIRLLHRNRVYVCTKHDCGAEFLTLKNLQSHQLRCFQIEKAFKCPRCFKEFHRKSNFKAHVRRHSDRKEFECQLCDRAFVDSTGLRRHFLKHHEPEQEIFVSGCCGKKFKSKEGLKKHIQNGICGVHVYQVTDSDISVVKENIINVSGKEELSEEENLGNSET